MGTTAQKLEYLGTTKSQLKDMINYGLDENKITSSTTFRNYVSSVKEAFLEALRTPDTLFTNLPKKSASGSNISLTGVANAPMRITLSPSELTQDSTPTPSSPQAVHTISGSNKVVVNGKNLQSGLESGGIDNSGNEYVSSSAIRSKYYVKVQPNTTYTCSLNGTSTNVNVSQYTGNKTFISLTFYAGTFTTSATTEYIRLTKSGSITDLIQLEIGSTATTYTPYVSQEAEIDLGVKNLFDIKTNNLYRGVVTSNGFFANTTAICCQKFIEVEPGETYTVSFDTTTTANINRVNFSFFVSNAFNRDSETGWITPFTATIPSNCHYILLSFKNNNTGTVDISDISNIQLEKGSVAHSYSEYGVEPINYSKIGNYEDKFIRTSGKNLFDGEWEDGQYSTSTGAKTTGSGLKRSVNYISVEPNTTYIISNNGTGVAMNVLQYKQDKTFISASVPSANTSFTTTANTYFITIFRGNTNIELVQVEKGTLITSYEPYGNGTWYIKKNIGKVVLDGTENWQLKKSGTSNWMYYYNSNIPISGDTSGSNSFCTHYPFGSVGNSNTTQGYYIVKTNGEIRIRYGTEDTTENYKTWLSNNNVSIYYELDTPTYTKITGTLETQLENVYQKLLSYSGTINISQVNNDLPFIMNVSAIEV